MRRLFKIFPVAFRVSHASCILAALAVGACESEQAVQNDRESVGEMAANATMTPEEEVALKIEVALAKLRYLEEALTEETAARKAADEELATRVTEETAARQAADEELATRVTEETAARKAADEALATRVTDLESGLSELRTTLTAEIERLDSELKQTNDRITSLESTLDTSISAAKADFSKQIATLSVDMNSRMEGLNASIAAGIAEVKSEIENAKQYAAQNYATKAELESLRVLNSRLQASMALLDKRIDENTLADEAFARLIQNELRDQAALFKDEISSLQVQDANFGMRLKQIVSDLTSDITRNNLQAQEQAQFLAGKIASVEAYNLKSHEAVQTEFEVLKMAIAGLSYTNTELRDSLNAKYAELSEADAALKLEFQDAIAQSVKQEQESRLGLHLAMESIKTAIEKVAGIANAANKLAAQGVATAEINKASLERLSQETRARISALEESFSQEITSLAQRTEETFNILDARYQRQAGEVTARLAEAELRLDQLTKSIASLLNQVPDMPQDAVIAFDNQTKEKRDRLTQAASEMGEGIGLFLAYILDAMDYLDETSRPNPQIAARFVERVVNSGMCADDARAPIKNDQLGVMEQASAGGYQWYRHLSAAYMRTLFFTPRSKQNAGDGIFLGIKPLEMDSLGGYALLSTLPDHFDSISTPGCKQAINDWAKSIIFGANEIDIVASDFRAKMSSRALRTFVTQDLLTRVANLTAAADEYQTALSNLIALRLANADIKAILFGGDNDDAGGIIQRLAFVLGELSEVSREQSRLAHEFDNMKAVLATHAAAQRKSASEISQLESAVDTLRNDIKRIKDEQSGEINALAIKLKKSLSLISVLANHVGRADVAMAAVSIQRSIVTKEEPTKTTGTGGLKSVRFAFPYLATGNEEKLTDCAGPVLAPGSQTLTGGTADCAGLKVLGNSAPVVIYRNNRKWASFATFSSTCVRYAQWYARLSASDANSICSMAGGGASNTGAAGLASIQGGKLQIQALAPWDEKARGRLPISRQGKPVPADKLVESNFILSVGDSTQAEYFKFWSGIPLEPYIVIKSSEFESKINEGIAYYEVPASFVYSKTAQGYWNTAQVSSLSEDMAETGTVSYALSANNLNLYSYSPIVVNLDKASMPRTTRWIDENVRFDLNGDGKLELIGWIAPGSYLLALDLNENGKIDDGRELFGTATLLPNGLRAEHGYKALQQYDDNQDGIIDRQDRIFSKLVLWGDQDQNGKSSPEELRSLKSASITKLSVAASPVTGADSITHEGSTGNRIYYKSKVFGPPTCGQSGCETFDVWFNFVPLSEPRMAGR